MGQYEGVLLVDKPANMSSHDVVSKLRRFLKEKRIGHAGTLDPFATGLLVILVGRYTKASLYLTDHDKIYEARIRLGESTSTDDPEGEITDRQSAVHIGDNDIQEKLSQMLGTQMQVPPIYSAISINGERSYQKARRGEQIEMKARQVIFYHLEFLASRQAGECREVDVRIHCSKGTYIRSFARDLGKALGLPAHLVQLRRTATGDFHIDQASSLQEIQAKSLQELSGLFLTGKASMKGLCHIDVSQDQAAALRQGKKILYSQESTCIDDGVSVAFHDDALIAFVRRESDIVSVVRGF